MSAAADRVPLKQGPHQKIRAATTKQTKNKRKRKSASKKFGSTKMEISTEKKATEGRGPTVSCWQGPFPQIWHCSPWIEHSGKKERAIVHGSSFVHLQVSINMAWYSILFSVCWKFNFGNFAKCSSDLHDNGRMLLVMPL